MLSSEHQDKAEGFRDTDCEHGPTKNNLTRQYFYDLCSTLQRQKLSFQHTYTDSLISNLPSQILLHGCLVFPAMPYSFDLLSWWTVTKGLQFNMSHGYISGAPH